MIECSMKKMDFKAVIFDMDGVLIDSEPLWHEAQMATFKTMGRIVTKEMLVRSMGLRVGDLIDYWFKELKIDNFDKKKGAAMILDGVTKLIWEKGEAETDAVEAVKKLHDNGYRLALASSSAMRIIDVVLEKLGIKKYFEIILTGDDEKRGKPFPDIYLTAVKKLGLEAKDCMVIEDSINGVRAAKAAGLYCIAVPNRDVKDREGFKIADRIIDSLGMI